MSRFIPTIEQLEDARQRLPNPYGYRQGHRIQVMCGMSMDYLRPSEPINKDACVPVLAFDLEETRVMDSRWGRQSYLRWVYNGQVRC